MINSLNKSSLALKSVYSHLSMSEEKKPSIISDKWPASLLLKCCGRSCSKKSISFPLYFISNLGIILCERLFFFNIQLIPKIGYL